MSQSSEAWSLDINVDHKGTRIGVKHSENSKYIFREETWNLGYGLKLLTVTSIGHASAGSRLNCIMYWMGRSWRHNSNRTIASFRSAGSFKDTFMIRPHVFKKGSQEGLPFRPFAFEFELVFLLMLQKSTSIRLSGDCFLCPWRLWHLTALRRVGELMEELEHLGRPWMEGRNLWPNTTTTTTRTTLLATTRGHGMLWSS